jgi:hypothetical protein
MHERLVAAPLKILRLAAMADPDGQVLLSTVHEAQTRIREAAVRYGVRVPL